MMRVVKDRGVGVTLLVMLAVVAVGVERGSTTTRAMTSYPATVVIHSGRRGAVLQPGAAGINTAVWDSDLLDRATVRRLRRTPVDLLRFPGGSTADVYHWKTNSITRGQNGYAAPANTFDHFMRRVAQPAHAGVIITVNYGSNSDGSGGGDPNEAAAWVRYANITHDYGVTYWEIGNEVYGNGYYGGGWETDLHADHSPTAYAQNALAYMTAMKAVDPHIKVGLVVTAPGPWPDGQGPQDWNRTVLSIAGKAADFIAVHWYPQRPGTENDSGLLASTGAIPAMVRTLRSELAQYVGAHAASMEIMVTETNSVSSKPGKQTTGPVNPLFLLEDYLTWLKNGVSNVTWWALRNGARTSDNNSTHLAGKTRYGDYGVLSSGSFGEPAVNRPLPTYTALQALRPVVRPGAVFLTTRASPIDLRAYALREPDGRIAAVLINRSATTSATTAISLAGAAGATSARASTFGPPHQHLRAARLPVAAGKVTVQIPPYGAAVVMITP